MRPLSFFAQFRTRLLLLILLIVLPTFCLLIYSSFEQRHLEQNRVREGAIAISQLAAANQENFINNTRQLLATLTQFPFLVLTTNRAFAEEHLSNLRKLAPNYINFGLIETNGLVFCSAMRASNSISLADRSYFQRVIQTKRFSAGDFQMGRLTGEPGLNFGYPVFDERGELKRVLFASLKLSRLSQAVAYIAMPQGGSISVIDRNGTILARQPEPEKWVGKNMSQSPVVQRIIKQEDGTFEMAGIDGIKRLHAITSIMENGTPTLFVSIGIPLSVSFAHANQTLARNLIILVLTAGILCWVAHWYAQRFVLRPVNALASAAEKLAQGNLAARAGTIEGPEEILQLGRSFDQMAERLEKRQKELELAHEEISRLNLDLENRVGERTAELEAANKELEAFSYSVSHDLRAPLRHISGFVNLLKRNSTNLDEQGLRHLNAIAAASLQMGSLVDDLLSFSRMARSELCLATVKMQDLVQAARLDLKADQDGRTIEWTVSRLPEIRGDPAMLRVVVNNLLANAIKYTRPRQPARIEIGSCVDDKEYVIFVRDNGVGFDMQYAGKLFGVFQRLHHDDEFEGTGIGLANVQRIILRHGGRVWADAKEGEGATFYFSVPKHAMRPEPSRPHAPPLNHA